MLIFQNFERLIALSWITNERMASRAKNKRSLDKDEINSYKGISEINSIGNSNGTLIGPASKKARGEKGNPLPG